MEQTRKQVDLKANRKSGIAGGKKMPRLSTMFDPSGLPPPLDIDLSQDLQAIVDQESAGIEDRLRSEYQSAFERYRAEASPFFFFCVCFQTEEQKRQFFAATGWDKLDGDMFVDGLAIARELNIDIQPVEIQMKPLQRVSEIFERKEIVL